MKPIGTIHSPFTSLQVMPIQPEGVPLLDIKPYIEHVDAAQNSRSGWMKGSTADMG